jgi:uncharacterized membrane protein YccC
VVGALTGHGLAYSWVALGAFQGSLADVGGPYRVRALSMSGVVVGGTLAVIIGSVATRWPAVAVPLAFVAAFVSGMVRLYGNAGAVVGVNNLVMTLVALAYPTRAIGVVLQRAEYFFVGAALAAVAALVIWPFQPNNPARVAVAECFTRLASLVEIIAIAPAPNAQAVEDWHFRARRAQASVREAVELASEQVAAVRRARDGSVRRGQQLLALLVATERLLGFLLPLPDLIDSGGLLANAPLAATLRALAGRLARVAVMVKPNGRVASGTGDAAATIVVPSGSVATPTLRRIAEESTIAEVLAVALARGEPMPNLAVGWIHDAPVALGVAQQSGTMRAQWALLRDNWGFQSQAFRHAMRLAVGVAAAETVAITTGLPRGYWLTVTTGIILQPYAGATVEKAIQRVAGTVAGVLVAALITFVLHAPLALILVLFPLTALTFAVRPISYGYFVLFLTPIFVLLAEGLHSDPRLAGYRLLNTVLGGALATICGALLWPAWEGEGLAVVLANAVDGDNNYLRAIVGDATTAEPVARRAMGLANSNAEAVLQRATADGQRSTALVFAGTTLVMALRRFGAALAAIGAARAAVEGSASDAALAGSAESVLTDLAASLRAGREPGPVPAWPVVEESRMPLASLMTRQLEVLHAAVARFVAAARGGAS